VILCDVDPTVREVLRASKLDALFEFAGDRASAIASARDAGPALGADHQPASPQDSPPEKPPLAPRPLHAPLRRRSPDRKST
jgi:hypothetical protein